MSREGWGVVTVSSIKLAVPDISDGQLVVQSSCAATHRLPRGFCDEISFGVTDLVILTNVGSDKATVRLQARLAPQDAIFIGSTRRASWALRRDEDRLVLLSAGEILLIRSAHAIEPHSLSARRPGGIPLRTGITVAS